MPKVPSTGPFKMFDTGSTENPISTSIKGSQKYNAQDNVEGNTKFSENIADAQIPLFDPLYAGNVFKSSDITKSSQWRGYPQEVSCYDCSFEEITDPSIKNITFACSVLDPQVSFNVVLSGTTSAINGAVTKQVSIGNTITGNISNVTNPPEQFIGWSFTPDGSTGILSTSTSYTHTVEEDITIYALVCLSDAIGVDFCFKPPSTGKTEICNECGSTVTVYFDRSEYTTSPIEDLIWYSDVALSSYSNSGYYRKKNTITRSSWFGTRTRTVIDNTIYEVNGSNGVAIMWDNCNGFISCT